MKQKRANIASALRTLAPDARQDLRRRLNLVADPQCRKQLHLLKELARFVRIQLKQLPQLRPGAGTMDKDLMRAKNQQHEFHHIGDHLWSLHPRLDLLELRAKAREALLHQALPHLEA